MITEEKTINGDPYLLIDILPVHQKSEKFYLGKIKASDLVQMFIVNPTHYDIKKNISLSESFVSDADYYKHISDNTKSPDMDQGFQRPFEENRAIKIKRFLEEEDYPFFPNTIIASCNLINTIEGIDLNANSQYENFKNLHDKPNLLSFIYQDQKTKQWKLLIPKKKGSVLIIDGQHRLEGLRRCSTEYQENYDVLVSFIVGYDRAIIAQQFYTINYEQKPVNRSILLHLMGQFNQGLDRITFLHNVVRLLNEHSTSPFQKRIKMLGVTPPDLDYRERNLLSVSQSFIIDRMERFINPKLATSKSYPPIFLYYFKNEDYRIDVIRFLIHYFSAIREIRKDWEDPTTSVISKGMGIGAFLTALHTIFPIMFVKEWNLNPAKIKEVNVNTFKNILSGIENINFTREGEFSGVASFGTMGKIEKAILKEIKYREDGEKEEFKIWLEKNLKL